MLTVFQKLFQKNKNFNNEEYLVDVHSHLIPAIDDGVQTLEESINIIKEMKNLGFEKLITTPHIMSHKYPNTNDTIKKGFEIVQEEVIKQNIDIELEFASEYYYDEHFLNLINKNDLLTFGDNYVLFELPYSPYKSTTPPLGIEQTVFELQNRGYKPVLAHPERYMYYTERFDRLLKLKDHALLFQMNANSFGGFYGKTAQKNAQRIVKEGLVNFIGSDIHNKKYLENFSKVIKNNNFVTVFEKNRIINSFL